MKKIIGFLLVFALLAPCLFANGQSDAASAEGTVESISFCTSDLYQKPEKEQAFKDLFKEDTGIDLQIIHLPTGDWTKMIMPLFAAGTNADVSQMPNQLTPFINQEFLVPLDSYIDSSPEWSEFKKRAPGVFSAGQFMGETYALGNKSKQSMVCWMRKDWLDKLGLPVPSSMEEMLTALKAFKTMQVPNGKTPIPLVMTSHVWNHDVFAAYFGVFNRVVKVGDKPFTDYYLTPEYKEYLDFMKNLYQNGLLDKETPTNRNKTVRQKFMEGYVGALVMWESNYQTLISGLKSNGFEDAEVIAVPPFEGPNGVFGLSSTEPPPRIAISSTAKNPKAVFDNFFNWVFFTENGIQSTTVGIPGFDFEVADGVYNLFDGHNMAPVTMSFPPADPAYSYPFKFDALGQARYDIINTVNTWVQNNYNKVFKQFPPKDKSEYWAIDASLYDKKRSLFGRYIMGEIDYPDFRMEYEKYSKEINLPSLIADLNN